MHTCTCRNNAHICFFLQHSFLLFVSVIDSEDSSVSGKESKVTRMTLSKHIDVALKIKTVLICSFSLCVCVCVLLNPGGEGGGGRE